MSCGTKIEGRFYSYAERQDLADRLQQDNGAEAARILGRAR